MRGLFVISILLIATPVWTQTQLDDGHVAFEETRRLLESGNDELGLIALQEFLQHFPSSPLAPEAEVRLGQLYAKRGDHDRAVAAFQTALTTLGTALVSGTAEPVLMASAREGVITSTWKKGSPDRAMDMVLKALTDAPPSDQQRRLHHLAAEIARAMRDPLRAIQHLMDERALVSEREPIETQVREVIDAGLPGPIAQTVIEAYPRDFPGDYILWRLIESYGKQGLQHLKEKAILRFLADFPGHPDVRKAHQALAALREQLKSPRVRVGALLPLSGQLADYGQRVLNGIQLAVEGAERTAGIVVKDTEGRPAKVEPGLEELSREYGVVAVIGPLLSREVDMISKPARRLGVPIVTPSAIGIMPSEAEPYLFRTAVTAAQQGSTLVEYAVRRLGLHRFAIIHSEDAYGRELMTIFSREVVRHGGEVIAVGSYAPLDTDFGRTIKHVRELDLVDRQRAVTPPSSGPPPLAEEYVPGFEAVFLPGDPEQVALLAAQLAFYDIRRVVILGAGPWTTESLRRLGGRFLEGSVFVDGFFAESPDPAVQAFVSRYQARFHSLPDLFAAQAYDATRLVIEAIERGAATGREVRDALLRVKDYHGVSGTTTITPTGESDRRLFVLRVQGGRLLQVETP